jgi:hypothetical protein
VCVCVFVCLFTSVDECVVTLHIRYLTQVERKGN